MASTPSSIGNVEQIGVGDALNTWGFSLNACIDRLTEMGVGVTSISLTGNKTLTTTNYVANESRWGGLRFTDGGLSSAPTVTFPAETRSWLVINTGSTYAVNCLAAGSGVSAVSVAAGKWAIIDCDGTDMFIRDLSNMGGDLALSSIADIASARVIGNMSGSTAAPSLITVYDEDNLASNSATGLATQQSIKAYVDTIASTGDLATVAGIASEITTVADIEDGTVATNAVTDVAGIASNVTTVAGISGNVTTVAGISANVTTVAGISANVTTVAGDSADIQALGPISANITTVAGISSDVTTVAADATDIGTVSTNIANVNTAATNIANVNTVAGISGNITTVAGISADVTTVATNVADVSNFADKYQISASDPTTRADASALQEGDLYYNTTTDQFNVYDGSAWQQAVFSTANSVFGPGSSTVGNVPRYDNTSGTSVDAGLAVGTSANNLVQLDGSARLPAVDGSQLTNLPSSAGVDLLTETVVSTGVASVEFTGLDTSTYQTFVLEVTAASHADGSNQSFLVQLSPDSGSTWRTTAYSGNASRFTGSFSTITNTTGAIQNQTAIGAGDEIYFVVSLLGMSSASELTAIQGQSSHYRGTAWEAAVTSGSYTTAEAHDSVRVITTSGNIDAGIFRIYGLK